MKIDPLLERCCRFPETQRRNSTNEQSYIDQGYCAMPTFEKCCGHKRPCYHFSEPWPPYDWTKTEGDNE